MQTWHYVEKKNSTAKQTIYIYTDDHQWSWFQTQKGHLLINIYYTVNTVSTWLEFKVRREKRKKLIQKLNDNNNNNNLTIKLHYNPTTV